MASFIEMGRAKSIGWREEGKDRFEPRQGEKQNVIQWMLYFGFVFPRSSGQL